jgi:hypothetical protein
MSKKKTLNYQVTEDELKRTLRTILNSPYSTLIANVIIDNLKETDVGLNQFTKALSGISSEIPFKVLEDIWVPYENLATWRLNKQAMLDNGMVIRGYVKCSIVEIHPTRSESLRVKYFCRLEKSPEIVEFDTYDVSHDVCLKATEDFIE